jgi:hypothetical protein
MAPERASRTSWRVTAMPREKGETHVERTFSREEYHRLALVIEPSNSRARTGGHSHAVDDQTVRRVLPLRN